MGVNNFIQGLGQIMTNQVHFFLFPRRVCITGIGVRQFPTTLNAEMTAFLFQSM